MKHAIMAPDCSYTVDDQFFADILSTALGASGIEYWCAVVTYTSGENPALDHADIIVHEGEDDTHYHITMETVMNGVQRVMQDPPANPESRSNLVATYAQMWEWLRGSLQDNDTVMVDAEVADMVIQYGLFEELRYG